MQKKEQIISAINSFKDWTNYLLVTTVAALGWVSTGNANLCNKTLFSIICWCFALSIVFGILTLALVPLVTENVDDDTKSFYEIKATFKVLCTLEFWKMSLEIKKACWPQHLFFIAGILLYAYGVT